MRYCLAIALIPILCWPQMIPPRMPVEEYRVPERFDSLTVEVPPILPDTTN